MSLQERLDAALKEKRELTMLRTDQRLRRWLLGATASNARRGRFWSERSQSLASTALQQALQEKAALLELRAQRHALRAEQAAADFRTYASTSSVQAADGVPPSPTAFRLQEERQRLRILQQQSVEKLAYVRALTREKAELQEAARAAGIRTNVTYPPTQSQLRPTAPPFTISSASALDGCVLGTSAQSGAGVSSAATGDPNTLTYACSFRPEQQDATGAVWPFDIESTITLELSQGASSTITGTTAVDTGSTLGFVLTRRDRIRHKGPSNVAPGVGEHVTTREWSGDCSLVPHHHVDASDGMTIEIDATLRARHRRNYHKALPSSGAGEDKTRQRRQQQHGEEEPYNERLKEPVVRGGRITASGHRFVVWGWGGDETVTLVSIAEAMRP